MRLKERTAIVTGAAGGLGSAIARRLVAEGAAVCLADLRSAAELAAELRGGGARAIDQPTDVTDSASVATMVEAALAQFGTLDVLVNVAGVTSHGSALDVTIARRGAGTRASSMRRSASAAWRRCSAMSSSPKRRTRRGRSRS